MAGVAAFRQDVAFGARMLARTPGVTFVAILSLALGIGANTAIFSLIDILLLRQLPVRNPQELVALTKPSVSGTSIGLSTGERPLLTNREFEALRSRTSVFSGMFGALSNLVKYSVRIDGRAPEDVQTRLVSGDYCDVLGATAFAGRVFTTQDERGPGSAPYAVISYNFWQRRFAGSLRPGITDPHRKGRPNGNRHRATAFPGRTDRRRAGCLDSARYAAAGNAGPYVAGR